MTHLLNIFYNIDFLSTTIRPAIESPFATDLSIEGMRSHNYSLGIFYFLIVGIAVFSSVALFFLFKDKTNKLKTGEKFLFAWIFLGIVVAVVFGATQLLQGFLF